MQPGSLPLQIYRGDSYRWQFTLWQDSAKTVPADLTGVTGKSEIRSAAGGTLVTDLTITITQPNIVLAELSADNSALITKSGVWDLQLTYPNGDVATVLVGAVTVTMDVTDSSASLMAAASQGVPQRLPGRPGR